jgi:hypothetical protein
MLAGLTGKHIAMAGRLGSGPAHGPRPPGRAAATQPERMFDMQALLDLFAQHGSLALGLAVLTEQLGSPLPSLPFLLLAGAQSGDALGLIRALAVSTGAAMSANALWFWAGGCSPRCAASRSRRTAACARTS